MRKLRRKSSVLVALVVGSMIVGTKSATIVSEDQSFEREERERGEHGLQMCKELPGWTSFSNEFAVGQLPQVGLINTQPESLVVWLASKKPRLVDAIWWWDPLDKSGKPKLNWDQLRATYERAAGDISRHAWLAGWKRAGHDRSIELVLYGTKIGTDDIDLKYELPAWQDAGLKGMPAYYVLFRRNRAKSWATVLFGREEARAIAVSNFLGNDRPESNHWLDRHKLSFHPAGKRGEEYSKYLVISPSGDWQLRTYSKAKPGGPRRNFPVRYSGGDGSSFERAVIITASDEGRGVDAEYSYLKEHFPGYRSRGQLLQERNGRAYDVIEFDTANGRKRMIYFDISSFLGKS